MERPYAVYYKEPGAAKPTAIVNFRFDVRDLARAVLYWRREGVKFQSRAALLRTSFELLISLLKLPEVTYEEAGEILRDELLDYTGGKMQGAVNLVVKRFQDAQYEQVKEKLKELDERNSSLESLLENLEVEPEQDSKEQTPSNARKEEDDD